MLARLPASDAAASNVPWSSWTPEMSTLSRIADEVQALRLLTTQVNLDKGKKAPDFVPSPRPHDPFAALKTKDAFERQKRLADRLLGRNKTEEERQAALAHREEVIAAHRAREADLTSHRVVRGRMASQRPPATGDE